MAQKVYDYALEAAYSVGPSARLFLTDRAFTLAGAASFVCAAVTSVRACLWVFGFAGQRLGDCMVAPDRSMVDRASMLLCWLAQTTSCPVLRNLTFSLCDAARTT